MATVVRRYRKSEEGVPKENSVRWTRGKPANATFDIEDCAICFWEIENESKYALSFVNPSKDFDVGASCIYRIDRRGRANHHTNAENARICFALQWHD